MGLYHRILLFFIYTSQTLPNYFRIGLVLNILQLWEISGDLLIQSKQRPVPQYNAWRDLPKDLFDYV